MTTRRTQAERTRDMRQRLIAATIDSLVEQGHARTTAVEVCRRAGVTRGAFHHHFPDLAALLAAAMGDTYERYFLAHRDESPPTTIADWIDRTWGRISQPRFKAVIEVWLAARNHPELAPGLQSEIDKYARIFSLGGNEDLRRRMGQEDRLRAFYRLCIETMIGLALGRATTPGGAALPHEDLVIGQLRDLSRSISPPAPPA